MNNNESRDGIKSRKEGIKPRQRVKFEWESEEEERGSPERGVKGWLDGDYKVGDVNFAIARVTEDRQVMQQLKFLESEEEAEEEMIWAVGDDNKKVLITLKNETREATISGDRKTITGGPGMLMYASLTWIPPGEAEQIRNRAKVPMEVDFIVKREPQNDKDKKIKIKK